MQSVSTQVAPEAIDPRGTGGGARSHYFEHPAGNLQADDVGGHLRGGDVQCTLATLVLGDGVSTLPRTLQRLSRDVGEGLGCLEVHKETSVIRQDVRIFSSALHGGSNPRPGLRQSVVARLLQRAFGDAQKDI